MATNTLQFVDSNMLELVRIIELAALVEEMSTETGDARSTLAHCIVMIAKRASASAQTFYDAHHAEEARSPEALLAKAATMVKELEKRGRREKTHEKTQHQRAA